MTKKKPILDDGIVFYEDYFHLFEFLSDKQLGELTRLLVKDYKNPKENPSSDKSVNNVYNYIASRIIKYREKSKFYKECGLRGGNPTLKGTDKGTINPRVKLTEQNRTEQNIKSNNIKEYKEDFESLWNEFIPYHTTKGSKKKALEVYEKIANDKNKEDIKNGIVNYCLHCKIKKQYTKQLERALRDELWKENYDIDLDNMTVYEKMELGLT